MTDRINALTVVLEKNVRTDDIEETIKAILCLRGILSVEKNVSNFESHISYERARSDLTKRIWDALKKDPKGT